MTNRNNSTNNYRYSLAKGSKKEVCPNCKRRTFVPYIDTQIFQKLPESYGRCDRESKCAYHKNPFQDGFAKEVQQQEQIVNRVSKVTFKTKKIIPSIPILHQTQPVYFDFNTFIKTLEHSRYEHNTFLQNLYYRIKYPFENKDISSVTELYRLGTIIHGYRAGAISFPFIDINNKVRAVQVKQFDKQNHTTGTDFLHSIIEKHQRQNNKPLPEWLEAYRKQDKFVSCLFGEHLLSRYVSNPIALVEAPKTAIYGTLYFGLPDKPNNYIWLAVYNKSSFSLDKLKVLKGRTVYVFPDLSKDGSTYKEWETKAKKFQKHIKDTKFIFSDLLEKQANLSEKAKGSDLADYLTQYDWRQFRMQQNKSSLTI